MKRNVQISLTAAMIWPKLTPMLGGSMADYDVVVVGAGNAAMAAAVSAREQGAGRVAILAAGA